jgi:hypothetical protein
MYIPKEDVDMPVLGHSRDLMANFDKM